MEPKYKLNRRDADRLHLLITREAINGPWLKRPLRKFPPLSPAEQVELESLHEKQRRKIWSHPKMQKVKRRNYYLHRRLKALLKKVEEAVERMEK